MNPLSVDDEEIFFSWENALLENGSKQLAFRIIVSSSEEDINYNHGNHWDSGKINDSNSCQVVYCGEDINNNEVYFWKVMYWDTNNNPSLWSEAAKFSRGIFRNGWKAKWIGHDHKTEQIFNPQKPYYCGDDFEDGENELYLPPVSFLRRTFSILKSAKRAIIYVSALGLVEVEINGKKINKEYFTPGYSDFNKTVYYRAYDVTEFLQGGENAIGVILADGWYSGYVGLNSRHHWGDKPRVLIQLEITAEDEIKQYVVSDEDWKASYGPITSSDIMHGESYDARLELEGWSTINSHDTHWKNVQVGTLQDYIPVSSSGLPIVEHKRFAPVSIEKVDKDKTIINFGQCIAGVVQFRVSGKRGTKLVIKHSEVLNNEGELYFRGNRSARSEDSYILKGNVEETYQPRFTYHGFQYVEIIGLNAETELLEIYAVSLCNQQTRMTQFRSSSEIVNKIFNMVEWTKNSNLFDAPTDVCARDERIGWGAEGNFFMHAASYLSDNAPFLRKWLNDILDGQLESGVFWPSAPAIRMDDINQFLGDINSDTGLNVIWLLYKIYGDKITVKKYFRSLERYFSYLESNNDRYIRYAAAGDWLSLIDGKHTDYQHGYGDSPSAIIGTSFFAASAQMMSELADAIGESERSEYYKEKFEKIRTVFQRIFIQRDNSIRSGTQSTYVLAIAFGLLNPVMEEKAYKWLTNSIFDDESNNCKITCGTASMLHALNSLKQIGLQNLATRFIVSEEFPSFGYMLKSGATSVWERWDTIREDGTFHPHPMNAFNHIGFATVGYWLIAGLAGISPLAPGFKQIYIDPGVTKDITSIDLAFYCMYGKISLKWKWDLGKFRLECTIPANTTAKIKMPQSSGENEIAICGSKGIIKKELAGKYLLLDIESGSYMFETLL